MNKLLYQCQILVVILPCSFAKCCHWRNSVKDTEDLSVLCLTNVFESIITSILFYFIFFIYFY